MNYKDVLVMYADYFQQSDVAATVMRWIGWRLVRFLSGICDLCQSLWEAVFGVLQFTDVISRGLGDYYYIAYSVLLVTVLAAGTMFMFSERRPPIVRNFIITAAVTMLLPGAVRTAADLLQIEQTAFMKDSGSVADTTILSNTTDLLYVCENGWDFSSPNCLSGVTIRYIDPNETVEKKTDKAFKYYTTIDAATGQVEYKEIKKAFFGLLTPLYYRYSINFMAIILEQAVNCLVLLFASYRLFRLIWDMVYGQILAYVLSGDVVSGEKTKQLLQYMLNLFWSISIMIWGFHIWRTFQTWLGGMQLHWFIRVLMIGFAGIAMVDGPDLVERIFGIDVGAKDGYLKSAMALRIAENASHSRLARMAAGGMKKAAGKAAGAIINPGMAGNRQTQPPTGAAAGRAGGERQQPPGGVRSHSPSGNSSENSPGSQGTHTGQQQNMGVDSQKNAQRETSENSSAAGNGTGTTQAAAPGQQPTGRTDHTGAKGRCAETEPSGAAKGSKGEAESKKSPKGTGSQTGQDKRDQQPGRDHTGHSDVSEQKNPPGKKEPSDKSTGDKAKAAPKSKVPPQGAGRPTGEVGGRQQSERVHSGHGDASEQKEPLAKKEFSDKSAGDKSKEASKSKEPPQGAEIRTEEVGGRQQSERVHSGHGDVSEQKEPQGQKEPSDKSTGNKTKMAEGTNAISKHNEPLKGAGNKLTERVHSGHGNASEQKEPLGKKEFSDKGAGDKAASKPKEPPQGVGSRIGEISGRQQPERARSGHESIPVQRNEPENLNQFIQDKTGKEDDPWDIA